MSTNNSSTSNAQENDYKCFCAFPSSAMDNVAWTTKLASTIKDLCLPTFTDVLSIPNAMQLLQGISYLIIAESWNKIYQLM